MKIKAQNVEMTWSLQVRVMKYSLDSKADYCLSQKVVTAPSTALIPHHPLLLSVRRREYDTQRSRVSLWKHKFRSIY